MLAAETAPAAAEARDTVGGGGKDKPRAKPGKYSARTTVSRCQQIPAEHQQPGNGHILVCQQVHGAIHGIATLQSDLPQDSPPFPLISSYKTNYYIYQGAHGIKTGSTSAAGYCLVYSA